ncbi:acyltransferase family protein [Pontibacter harenae]|uniref:acyltransferase family protein n=1 Tax=Pontibacter harenae TaxID=2894083 RepID=UPI001E508A68|nr:acyltransferase [Pontibacter harenae]MCC9165458.1 acyltransferase [Pontibacter harenae]
MIYFKQLDAVRALAVMLVIVSHWLPFPILQKGGFVGVNIFFVLSGFLITNILFDNKKEAEETGTSKLVAFKNFFFRRALRILPAYYFTVILVYFLSRYFKLGVDSELPYLLTFTTNIHFYNLKYFGDLTAHCWSLAVEEQFYFLWPWVILYTNKKYILPVILAFILTGTISQLFITNFEYGYLPTYTCFDAFGLGALLAWVLAYKPHLLGKAYKALHLLVILSMLLLAGKLSGSLNIPVPIRTFVSVIALCVITFLVHQGQAKKYRFSSLFNNKRLLFIGKISYGLYLYHIPIPYVVWAFARLINPYFPYLTDNYLYFALANISLLCLLPWLSWMCIEKPFLNLKKYFSYKKASIPVPVSTVVKVG